MLGFNFNAVTEPLQQTVVREVTQAANTVFEGQARKAPGLGAGASEALFAKNVVDYSTVELQPAATIASGTTPPKPTLSKASSLWGNLTDKVKAGKLKHDEAMSQLLGPKAKEKLKEVKMAVTVPIQEKLAQAQQTLTTHVAEPLAQKKVNDAARAATLADKTGQVVGQIKTGIETNQWVGSAIKDPLLRRSEQVSQTITGFKQGAESRVAEAMPQTLAYKQAVSAEEERIANLPINQAKRWLGEDTKGDRQTLAFIGESIKNFFNS